MINEKLFHVDNPVDRDVQAEKIIKFLDKIGAKEALATPEARLSFVKNLSFEEFKDWLTRMNGMLRDIKPPERSTDRGGLVSYNAFFGIDDIPPLEEDTEELLKETYEAIKRMDNTDDMALATGAAIGYIHPYAEANGRTSRLAFLMLINGYKGTEEDKEMVEAVLGPHGRSEINLHHVYIQKFVFKDLQKDLGLDSKTGPTEMLNIRDKTFENYVPEDEKRIMGRVAQELSKSSWGFVAVYKFMKEKGRLDPKYIKKNINNGNKTEETAIDLEALIQDLSKEEMHEIGGNYRMLKKEYLKKIFDIIEHPEKYPLDNEDFKNLKEYYQYTVTAEIIPMI